MTSVEAPTDANPSMRSATIALAILAVCGCGTKTAEAPPPTTSVSPDVVATLLEDTVTLAEVETHLRRTLQPGEIADKDPMELYRQAAETLAVRHHASTQLGDPIRTLKEQGEFDPLYRRFALELFLDEARGESPQITASEARDFYADNTKRFFQPAQRYAWHIFRRHRESGNSEKTDAFLGDLKRRVLAGESFAELARAHSDSESRVRGGQLGWVSRGQMARSLEEPLFDLQEGELSDPIPVPGGSVLFQVTELRHEQQRSFEDVRQAIDELLTARRQRQLIAEAAVGLEPPPRSTILDRQGLERLLKGRETEATVLEIDGWRAIVTDLTRRWVESGSDASPEDGIWEAYEQLLREALLVRHLMTSEWVIEQSRGETIEGRVVAEARPQLVDSWLEEKMRERVSASGEEVRAFYRDNQHLFQSPLHLELRTLSVPAVAGAAASRTMSEIESLKLRLEAGEIDFAATAARLGAEIEDHGWLDFQQLASLSPKLRTHVLALDTTGFTVPMHYGGRLHLAWVKDRQEPRPLAFEEAEEEVRDEFYERFRQRLYRELAQEILGIQEFRFVAENVQRALALPTG